ncbi:hypothetical protein PAXRUDRAFT_833564, partial [Paxillus rubicundulus Ve08.2h10]
PNASSSEALYWESYAYLTDRLLTWLLECPTDHTILFYDKSSGESSSIPTNARATGCHKKDIYPIITKELIEKDVEDQMLGPVQLIQINRCWCEAW